jgi:flagellar biosynthesis anti-sigma factor FlgM
LIFKKELIKVKIMTDNGKSKAAKKKALRAAHRRLPLADPPFRDDSRLIAMAREIVRQTAEVRPEKVAAIKDAIDRGGYEIDTRKLAQALIAKLLNEP